MLNLATKFRAIFTIFAGSAHQRLTLWTSVPISGRLNLLTTPINIRVLCLDRFPSVKARTIPKCESTNRRFQQGEGVGVKIREISLTPLAPVLSGSIGQVRLSPHSFDCFSMTARHRNFRLQLSCSRRPGLTSLLFYGCSRLELEYQLSVFTITEKAPKPE